MKQLAATLELSQVRPGTLHGLTANGIPLVLTREEGSGGVVQARTCVPLDSADVGREVVLLFELERPDSPIVLGVIRSTVEADGLQITADRKNVTLSAQESITLECGEAKITLHRTGKVLIRGAHVVSHSRGVNRIRGGSVELN